MKSCTVRRFGVNVLDMPDFLDTLARDSRHAHQLSVVGFFTGRLGAGGYIPCQHHCQLVSSVHQPPNRGRKKDPNAIYFVRASVTLTCVANSSYEIGVLGRWSTHLYRQAATRIRVEPCQKQKIFDYKCLMFLDLVIYVTTPFACIPNINRINKLRISGILRTHITH